MYIYGLYDRRCRLRYIGQAANPHARLRKHWHSRNEPEYRSRKNKWLRTLTEPPEMRILAIVENSDVKRTERAAIAAARKRFGRKQITNWREYGTDPLVVSPETRAKMSASSAWKGKPRSPEFKAAQSDAMKGNQHLLGHVHSAETRAKISAGNKGKKRSPETRARMSAASRRRAAEVSAIFKGKPKSPEHRAKIAAALYDWFRPCKGCGGPQCTFRVDPPCEVCQRRSRMPYWRKRLR